MRVAAGKEQVLMCAVGCVIGLHKMVGFNVILGLMFCALVDSKVLLISEF